MPYNQLDPSTAAVIPSTGQGDPVLDNGLTLAELRDELALAGGGSTDIGTPRLNLWINWGYVDLATDLKLDELKGSLAFDLVAGQPFYKLPKEVWSTIGASVLNENQLYPEYGGIPLNKITISDYRKLPELEDDVPTKYFRHGDMLVIYPTPSTVYPLIVDFRIRPLFMVNDLDCPILGLEWHEGIVLAARAKMHRMTLEPELSAISENEFHSFVRKKEGRAEMEEEGRRPKTDAPQKMSGKMMYRRPYGRRDW